MPVSGDGPSTGKRKLSGYMSTVLCWALLSQAWVLGLTSMAQDSHGEKIQCLILETPMTRSVESFAQALELIAAISWCQQLVGEREPLASAGSEEVSQGDPQVLLILPKLSHSMNKHCQKLLRFALCVTKHSLQHRVWEPLTLKVRVSVGSHSRCTWT